MLHLSTIEASRLLKASGPTKKINQAVKGAQEKKLTLDTVAHLSGLPGWVTEHRFHPVRKWRLDYAWPEMKIALEVHGGVRSGGRHTRGTGFTNDREKMNTAASMGWIIIEATADQIRNGQARAWLNTLFKQRGVAA